ncbi:hypothetical protein IJG26_02215 [Candidatus Saccharibacteria bacterium]|nr:hypothetical protein [Candidatus Saccharibacteria bacterium]MBR0415673.1 hypothetical protein [Candidatus Saccharibacteria bacterium]
MFTHQLSKEFDRFGVYFSAYAEQHFLKKFRKKYKGKIWEITEKSIVADLSRISNNLQSSQQVDELKSDGKRWLFKYDFAVAKSGKSPKKSGNRCVCLLDTEKREIKILAIYTKDDLPKNMGETQWIKEVCKQVETFD